MIERKKTDTGLGGAKEIRKGKYWKRWGGCTNADTNTRYFDLPILSAIPIDTLIDTNVLFNEIVQFNIEVQFITCRTNN